MTQFLILKLEGDTPRDARITAFVEFDGESQDAIRQGFDGEGQYAILDWEDRLESGLVQGPVEVTEPEDRVTRVERAEAEMEAEVASAEEPAKS